MHRFPTLLAVLPPLLFALLTAAPASALAAPGGTGVERFGTSALEFLSGTLGPIVLGIGIAIAAYGLSAAQP